jgi:hypothetical protein
MLALADSALAPLYHLRHGPKPDRRRALELLASCCDGFEAIMLAYGFTIEQIVFVLLHSGRTHARGLDISFVHSSATRQNQISGAQHGTT